jgi:hypothetical protein
MRLRVPSDIRSYFLPSTTKPGIIVSLVEAEIKVLAQPRRNTRNTRGGSRRAAAALSVTRPAACVALREFPRRQIFMALEPTAPLQAEEHDRRARNVSDRACRPTSG